MEIADMTKDALLELTSEEVIQLMVENGQRKDTEYIILKDARFFVATFFNMAQALAQYDKVRAEHPEWNIQLVAECCGDETSRVIK